MVRILLVFLAVMFAGCKKSEEEKPQSPVPTVPPSMRDFAEKLEKSSARQKEKKAEADAFLARIKTDPQPLFDRAVEAVKKGLADMEGDDSANAATITVDKKSLKTFGPEKWKVRGHLSAKDQRGKPHETTWEVTLQMMFDALQVMQTDLQVSD